MAICTLRRTNTQFIRDCPLRNRRDEGNSRFNGQRELPLYIRNRIGPPIPKHPSLGLPGSNGRKAGLGTETDGPTNLMNHC
jgi:hypothetical protein